VDQKLEVIIEWVSHHLRDISFWRSQLFVPWWYKMLEVYDTSNNQTNVYNIFSFRYFFSQVDPTKAFTDNYFPWSSWAKNVYMFWGRSVYKTDDVVTYEHINMVRDVLWNGRVLVDWIDQSQYKNHLNHKLFNLNIVQDNFEDKLWHYYLRSPAYDQVNKKTVSIKMKWVGAWLSDTPSAEAVRNYSWYFKILDF